ncbi:MAG: hypothetical protein IIY21_08785 [Clostridiales bacterium]|nr:hypothetical protein [Clostridiales bacterium]MBQ1573574.1 hypothetical protein [Clostridiales bacterium]
MGSKSRYTGDWSALDCRCDILDKRKSIYNYVLMMFDRTNQMFEYKGLPDTIPAHMLELYLQINGHIGWLEWNGNLYALPGGWGGALDPYYRPTIYIVANPALGGSQDCKIVNHLPPFDETVWSTKPDCVLMRNDTNMRGLFYLFSRYATELSENDISIRSAQINSRQQSIIAASTDREIASARAYIKALEDGKLEAVMDQAMATKGIRATNVSVQSANVIIQLIELQQYLKASWYNEIGLNANFNMKREYLSEEELMAQTDTLIPLIDDMLRCRKEAIEVVNSTFGTSISVDKNSAWENKQKELETEQDYKEAQVESTKPDGGAKEQEEKDE